jgi:hypothetical protein
MNSIPVGVAQHVRVRQRWCDTGAEAVSGGEPSAGLLHARERGLGLRERTRANVDARGLARDRDLLTGRRITPLTRLRRRLDTHRQLHHTTDPDLLRIPKLLEHDLLKRLEHPLGLSATDISAVSDGTGELCLGQRQRNLPCQKMQTNEPIQSVTADIPTIRPPSHNGRPRYNLERAQSSPITLMVPEFVAAFGSEQKQDPSELEQARVLRVRASGTLRRCPSLNKIAPRGCFETRF